MGRVKRLLRSRTDRRSAAGRAPSRFWNHQDRDARTVRCNGWLCEAGVAAAWSVVVDGLAQLEAGWGTANELEIREQ